MLAVLLMAVEPALAEQSTALADQESISRPIEHQHTYSPSSYEILGLIFFQ